MHSSASAQVHLWCERVAEGAAKGGPRLPPALDDLVLRALDRDPARRLPSAAAMVEALTGYLNATHFSSDSVARLLEDVFGTDSWNEEPLPEMSMTPIPEPPTPQTLVAQSIAGRTTSERAEEDTGYNVVSTVRPFPNLGPRPLYRWGAYALAGTVVLGTIGLGFRRKHRDDVPVPARAITPLPAPTPPAAPEAKLVQAQPLRSALEEPETDTSLAAAAVATAKPSAPIVATRLPDSERGKLALAAKVQPHAVPLANNTPHDLEASRDARTRGLSLLENGQIQQARIILEAALVGLPGDAVILNGLGERSHPAFTSLAHKRNHARRTLSLARGIRHIRGCRRPRCCLRTNTKCSQLRCGRARKGVNTLIAVQAELAGTAHASLAATARLSAEGARDSTRQAARLARELGQATVEATEANELAARLEREGSPLAERARQTLREAVAAIEPAARASQASAQEAARVTEQAITAIANLKTAAGAFVSSVARDALDSSFAVARVGLSTAVEQTVIMVGHGVEWLARGATIVLADYVGGSTIAEVFEFLLGADMILPVGDGLNEDRAVRSRNVPSHEYGHFVMCNLLERADPVRFRIAYNEAAADGVLGQTADKQHVVINQASADFFNGQIAGAANYWDPDRAFGGDYCPTAAPDTCWEDNVGGPGQKTLTNPDPFNEQVAVISSIFHDSFDGHDLARDQARPTNGNPWGTASGAAITYDTLGSHASDEVVALPGGDIFPWIRRVLGRGTLLRFENVFSGLSETMAARNLNWCQRCEVFRLHSKNPQSCPEAWVGPRPPGLVCAWEPCSPPNIIIPDKRICDTCKSNFSFCSYDEATMGCVCPVL